jgi:hypothetical protein
VRRLRRRRQLSLSVPQQPRRMAPNQGRARLMTRTRDAMRVLNRARGSFSPPPLGRSGSTRLTPHAHRPPNFPPHTRVDRGAISRLTTHAHTRRHAPLALECRLTGRPRAWIREYRKALQSADVCPRSSPPSLYSGLGAATRPCVPPSSCSSGYRTRARAGSTAQHKPARVWCALHPAACQSRPQLLHS